MQYPNAGTWRCGRAHHLHAVGQSGLSPPSLARYDKDINIINNTAVRHYPIYQLWRPRAARSFPKPSHPPLPIQSLLSYELLC